MSRLEVIHGAGGIIEMLETALERARAGQIDCLAIGWARPDEHIEWGWSFKDDAVMPWARLVTVSATINHKLLTDGC